MFRLFVHGLKKGLLMSETTLFLVFATFTLLSALMVIRSKNPVYSVLFLILVFCNAAGLLVLLDLDFFAVVKFSPKEVTASTLPPVVNILFSFLPVPA